VNHFQQQCLLRSRLVLALTNLRIKRDYLVRLNLKPQQWIPLSPAFQEVTSVPGIPTGHIVLLRGHSDTGKTTALIEAAVNAQKSGILPVFIITEMKWNWEHATQMGLQMEEVYDEENW
jgi:RecA/RadA recombinase